MVRGESGKTREVIFTILKRLSERILVQILKGCDCKDECIIVGSRSSSFGISTSGKGSYVFLSKAIENLRLDSCSSHDSSISGGRVSEQRRQALTRFAISYIVLLLTSGGCQYCSLPKLFNGDETHEEGSQGNREDQVAHSQ